MDRLFQYVGGKESHSVKALVGLCFFNASARYFFCRSHTLKKLKTDFLVFTLQERSLILASSTEEHSRSAGQVIYDLNIDLTIVIWPLF